MTRFVAGVAPASERTGTKPWSSRTNIWLLRSVPPGICMSTTDAPSRRRVNWFLNSDAETAGAVPDELVVGATFVFTGAVLLFVGATLMDEPPLEPLPRQPARPPMMRMIASVFFMERGLSAPSPHGRGALNAKRGRIPTSEDLCLRRSGRSVEVAGLLACRIVLGPRLPAFAVARCGLCPRSQRRVRAGFTPASLARERDHLASFQKLWFTSLVRVQPGHRNGWTRPKSKASKAVVSDATHEDRVLAHQEKGIVQRESRAPMRGGPARRVSSLYLAAPFGLADAGGTVAGGAMSVPSGPIVTTGVPVLWMLAF